MILLVSLMVVTVHMLRVIEMVERIMNWVHRLLLLVLMMLRTATMMMVLTLMLLVLICIRNPTFESRITVSSNHLRSLSRSLKTLWLLV